MATKTKQQEQLKAKIDEYGLLKEQIKELEDKAKAIYDELNTLPEGTYLGDKFILDIGVRVSNVIDPVLVAKKIGSKVFSVVSVVKKELQKYMSDREIDECIKDSKETKYITIKRLK